ncbi:hypothetical protein SEA_YARA_101 [Streptomyces phage Yara]|nr:hypothetical protein SEA_YARA_101 [Streptomyces phage Yara]
MAACHEPDPDTPPITSPSKPRRWVEDILPDISCYEEPDADTPTG